MLPRVTVLAAAVVAATCVGPSPAAAAAPPADIAASSYLVADGATGQALAARAPARPVPIASITKLMTVLLALERSRPQELASVQADVTTIGESTVNLRAGERISVRDLVAAALIQSANDAAVTLADHVAGDERSFVASMNRRAARMRLHETHFERPDGLDVPGHLSSARDVTKLARVAMRRPLIRALVRQENATIAGGRGLHTWNDLLGDFPGLLGVKTGHTSAAGWCQVAAARGDGVTIYATLLGSPTRARRNADLARLLGWGLAQYRRAPVVSTGRTYATAETPWEQGEVRLMAPRTLTRPVRVGQSLVERIVAPTVVELPVERGQRLGHVQVLDRGRVVARSPLVAARSVAKPGVVDRAGWYAGRMADHIGGWFG